MTKHDKLSIGIVLPPKRVFSLLEYERKSRKSNESLEGVMKKAGIGNYNKYFKEQKYRGGSASKYFAHNMS